MTPKQVTEFKERIRHPSARRNVVRQILSRTDCIPTGMIEKAIPPDFDVVTCTPIASPEPLDLDLLDPYLAEMSMEKLGKAIVSTHVAMVM